MPNNVYRVELPRAAQQGDVLVFDTDTNEVTLFNKDQARFVRGRIIRAGMTKTVKPALDGNAAQGQLQLKRKYGGRTPREQTKTNILSAFGSYGGGLTCSELSEITKQTEGALRHVVDELVRQNILRVETQIRVNPKNTKSAYLVYFKN